MPLSVNTIITPHQLTSMSSSCLSLSFCFLHFSNISLHAVLFDSPVEISFLCYICLAPVYLITECPENTHSFSCISCPPNCVNGCSAVDGTCKNDCKRGKFGRMCHRDCHHVCSDGTCDRHEGRCSQGVSIILHYVK